MGKQIQFYMDDRDATAFVVYLRTTGDIAIIPKTSIDNLKEEFRDFSETVGRPLGEGCLLWNRSISPRPTVKHYPQQGYYCVDSLQSEVIDFWRSKMTPQGLSMGRLWMETTVLETGGQMRLKGENFAAWYSTLSRWVIQQSIRRIDGAYVLPGADAMIRSGTQVTGHVL